MNVPDCVVRSVILYLTTKNKTTRDIYREVCATFEEGIRTEQKAGKWQRAFHDGRRDVQDLLHSGRHRNSITKDAILSIRVINAYSEPIEVPYERDMQYVIQRHHPHNCGQKIGVARSFHSGPAKVDRRPLQCTDGGSNGFPCMARGRGGTPSTLDHDGGMKCECTRTHLPQNVRT